MGIALSVLEEYARLRREDAPHVLVTVVGARGSTPQDAGAKMLVDANGRIAGTVGGGKVEAAAIRHAIELLAAKSGPATVTWNLQRDIGMTCGGEMQLFFDPHGGAAGSAWTVAVFGAGHVAQALVPVLAPLDCRILCFDSRPEWLARLPTFPNLRSRLIDQPESAIEELPPHAFVLAITQGHATDLPVLRRALPAPFPFVGAIGSLSKRSALERDLRAAGIDEIAIARLQCPLGLPLGSNNPHEIAISIVAGLLTARDAASSAVG